MSRVIFTILVVVGILIVAAGIGFAGFRLGMSYGIAQSPQLAAALSELPEGAPGWHGGFGMRPGYGYYGPWHAPWGLGLFECLAPLFFLFLLFGLFRLVFRPWGWGWHKGWGHHGPPPSFEEWHKRAHGEAAPPAGNQAG